MKVLLASEPKDGIRVVLTEFKPGEWTTHLQGTREHCPPRKEEFFSGHFPGAPVMPGVLVVEALAQTGGILLLHTVESPENVLVYFMGIDKVRFRRPVMPGDQLRLEAEMLRMKGRTCKLLCRAFVDAQLVAEGELMAIVQDRPQEPGVEA